MSNITLWISWLKNIVIIGGGIRLPETAKKLSSAGANLIVAGTLLESLPKIEDLIKFRDENFIKYHNYKPFLEKIEKKFGKEAVTNIVEMTKIKLKRKVLGDQV